MILVSCAIIQQENDILICQRSATMALPLKWEFPGGKIEAGESKEACLRREIEEELGLEITVGKELPAVTHAYPTFAITLYPFLCKVKRGSILLAEHAQAIWVPWQELNHFDWAAADEPIVAQIMQLCAAREV